MKKQIRFIIIWTSVMYALTTFIFPLIGISDNKIDLAQILFNLGLWVIIGFGLYFYEKSKFKKLQARKNEKLD